MCVGVVSFWSLTNQTWENEMRDLIKLRDQQLVQDLKDLSRRKITIILKWSVK
jgi:hypothetical protein